MPSLNKGEVVLSLYRLPGMVLSTSAKTRGPELEVCFGYQNWHILETKFYRTWFILVYQLWW